MKDNLYYNFNDFYFYIEMREKKLLPKISFILKNDFLIYKSSIDENGRVDFKNIKLGSYNLIDKFTKNVYKVEIMNNFVLIDGIGFKEFKIVYDNNVENKYLIYYNSNDDTNEIIFEDNMTILEDIFESKNRFLYWNTNRDSSGESYYQGETIDLNDNIELFAIRKSLEVSEVVCDDFISGKGIIGSEIKIIFSNGYQIITYVNLNKEFKVKLLYNIIKNCEYCEIYQTEKNMVISNPVKIVL